MLIQSYEYITKLAGKLYKKSTLAVVNMCLKTRFDHCIGWPCWNRALYSTEQRWFTFFTGKFSNFIKILSK